MDDAGRTRKKAYVAAYKQGVRLRVIIKYGGKCECCGEAELAFLVIDHVEGGGTKARGTYAYAEYTRILNAPVDKTKYQVLCANCNMARERLEGCPHQTQP
jgi:hypothetical protein